MDEDAVEFVDLLAKPDTPIHPTISTSFDPVGWMKLFGFLLEQTGGSIVISPSEYGEIIYSNKMIYSYRDERGNYILKVGE